MNFMEFLRTPFLIEPPQVATSCGYTFLGKKKVIVFYFKNLLMKVLEPVFYRGSRPELFCKKVVLRNLGI